MRRWLVSAIMCLITAASARASVAPGFTMQSATPGQVFDTPTGIAFLPDGRMLVCEKAGRLWLVQNGSKGSGPIWDHNREVLNVDDKGLLDVAVDPNFNTNQLVYLLYTVDPDSDAVDTNTVAFGRLVRYHFNGTTLDESTRAVLMGVTWLDAPEVGSETHTIGSLRWGADGSLLVTAGEGASDAQADPGGLSPALFLAGRADPYEDIGAFRSQYVGSLAGKVLRLNPATGQGYASNPFYDGNLSSKRSRVWEYGLRNPFRFTVKPGTGASDPSLGQPGTLYIGDVGWGSYEEINVAHQGGLNFGWPCMEGLYLTTLYEGVNPSHAGCGTLGTSENPATSFTAPLVVEDHGTGQFGTPVGLVGNCTAGTVFYTGTTYPAQYRGALFFEDYGRNWLKVLTVDANDQMVALNSFADTLQGPVDLATNPVTGDVYYTSIWTGEVRTFRYTGGGGGNQPPVAAGSATPGSGTVPLTVAFSSAGSSDPDGDALLYAWDFGDGSGTTLPNPSHQYTAVGNFTARLTVDDQHGNTAAATFPIVVSPPGSFPTTPVVDAFNRANGPVGNGWTGDVGSVSIVSQALAIGAGAPAIVWPTLFTGATQEVYATFHTVTAAATEQNLILQVQGTTGNDPHVEVSWSAPSGRVTVWTFTPGGGWVQQGAAIPVVYQAGDRMGARVYGNGSVEVYRNTTLVGTTTLSNWAYLGAGGRIGMSFWNATQTVMDDFGGGNGVSVLNTPPVATIVAPADSAFYTANVPILLSGTASDAQDPTSALSFRWDVFLRRSDETHLEITAFTDTVTFLPGLNFDPSPTWYDLRLTVTDTGGLADTVTESIFPNINLVPSNLAIVPSFISTQAPTRVSFTFTDNGTMPDPYSHWVVSATPSGGGAAVTLVEGDTLQGLGSPFTMVAGIPPVLAPGSYTLHVALDTQNQVPETNEADNVASLAVTVMGQTTAADGLPASLALSAPRPNPTSGEASFTLDLPQPARVALVVADAAGRAVWSAEEQDYAAGRWTLRWPGADRSGRPAPAGLYLARLSVSGRTFVRRVAVLR